jgi:outer membrane protein assembly factor BamB
LAAAWFVWGAAPASGPATGQTRPATIPLPEEIAPGAWRKAAEGEPNRPGWGGMVHDASSARNLKWVAPLGPPMAGGVCYGAPAVGEGKILIGCDGSAYDERYVHPADYFTASRFGRGANQMKRAALLCLEEATGRLVWQYNVNGHRRYSKIPEGGIRVGVCNRPAIDGGRAYFVGYQNEVMCVDLAGQANGNQGPFLDEREHFRDHWPTAGRDGRLDRLRETDADVLWMYHVPRELGFTFDCAASSSPLLYDGRLYVGTCVGVAHRGVNNHKRCDTPGAPALIVLDQRTGRLLAAENEGIASRVQHGAWCSPSLVEVGGRKLVLFGGGDEWCYAFDPQPRAGVERSYAAEDPNAGTVTIPARVGVLRCVWKFNANGDNRAAYSYYQAARGMTGAVIGTPGFDGRRAYVNVGVDWSKPCKGLLSCYDAAGSGDISAAGRVWLCESVGASCSSPTVAGGLVFTADFAGNVHCVDAADGSSLWTHKLGEAIHSSPLVADGKVYAGGSNGSFVILRARRQKEVLCQTSFCGERCANGIEASPAAANGVLYVPTRTVLYAFEKR